MQGHHEAGRLWEAHVTAILISLGWRSTTHEKNIYQMVFDGIKILLARQVDDLAIACPTVAMAKKIVKAIGERLQLPSEV